MRKNNPTPKLCKCGCGETTNVHNGRPRRFIVKHYARTFQKKRELIPCACGCGLKRINYDEDGKLRQFINGHQKIGTHYIMSEEHKQAISLANMGRVSPSKAGKLNAMYGKRHSVSSKQKISSAMLIYWKRKKKL